MKNNFYKEKNLSLWLFSLGLSLLLINCVLELGILPNYEDFNIKSPIVWILSIISKMVSAIGTALIIGFATDIIKKLINAHNIHSNDAEQVLIDDICELKDEFNLYQQNHEYVTFIEGLFYNNAHNFSLLPRIRMYLHKYNIVNDIHIINLNITCIISGVKNLDDGSSISNSQIIFEFEISRDTIVETYEFITGNDFSTETPTVKFSYGNQEEYNVILNSHVPSSDSANLVRTLSLNIQKDKIPMNEQTWNMKLVFDYVRLFDFDKIEMDTIICLPKVFGKNIDKINYTIKVVDYKSDKNFYCNLHKCSIIDGKFNISTQGVITGKTKNNENAVFHATIYPDSYDKEHAYYFRFGTSNIDKN